VTASECASRTGGPKAVPAATLENGRTVEVRTAHIEAERLELDLT